MPKSYWMIFISSIHLNQNHYDPELPSFHFLDSVSPHSLCFKKKKLSLSTCTHSGVQFPLCWLAYLYSAPQFLFQSSTCIQKQSPLQNLDTCISLQFPLWSLIILVFLLHHLSSLTSTSIHRSKENAIQKSKETLSNSSSDRVCDQRKVTASFFHTFHFIILFLSFHSFLLIISV